MLEKVKNSRVKNWKTKEKDNEVSFMGTPIKSVISGNEDRQSVVHQFSFQKEGMVSTFNSVKKVHTSLNHSN